MKVLIATGGSGGHIFPALQTALQLKKQGVEVIFVGTLLMAEAKIRSEGFECYILDAQGFVGRSISGFYRFSSLMCKAFAQSVTILRTCKPDKIIGFGGYGSFPVVLAGCVLGVPCMIHEQNIMPGKANRILAKLVKKVAVAFKASVRFFGKKAVWTGCPCHDQPSNRLKSEICKSFGLNPQGVIIRSIPLFFQKI